MIILDTNVFSEIMKKEPSKTVVTWLNDQNTEDLFLTVISIAEISYGLRILPRGKRRRLLENKFEMYVESSFMHRVLKFDMTTAKTYGKLMGYRKKIGRPMSIPDGQIASIALVHHFAVASRNTKDFDNCGLEVINPF